MTIRIRVILVIILITLSIILFSVLAVSIFVRNIVERSQETDLMLIADIADHFTGSEVDSVKMRAMMIAQILSDTGNAEVEWQDVLSSQLGIYPQFKGMAVVDSDGRITASAGVLPEYSGLLDDLQVKQAFQGKIRITTSIPSSQGMMFYLSAPIPKASNNILVITLPGMFFAEMVASFVIWDTGHIFIDDAEGTIIANIREEWVQNRQNFIVQARTNKGYEETANVIMRAVKGETGIGFFSIAGIPRICAFKPITNSEEGWLLGVIAPLPESPFRNSSTGLIVVGLVSFLLSIIAAIIASGFIKRPFEEVARLKEIAEANSEAKSVFLANMSHELRTPMNSIIGFSDLAINDRLPNETKDYLNKIQLNSEWLLQIINDILDISKIESGKMELEHITFDLHEMFIACRMMITPKADEKGVNLYFYAEPSIDKKLNGDPVRLRQVLLNLLSNAVKFTSKGGLIKVSATVTGIASDTIAIHFEVKDSGIGMTPEQLAKISQPFMQADMTTTRKYGGTGLGVAISKNIIEMMGGKLKIESVPGVGSKFSFDITFDTTELAEAASEMMFMDGPIEKPFFNGKILFCEDNQMNQQVLTEHLERVGIKADIAENGREGYNMVKRRLNKGEKPYDLIFMDIHMPVMDGIEASTLINELNTGTPIVAMTANIMSHDRELYQKSGMKDSIGKPFRVQELWAYLLKYLKPVKWDAQDEAENRQQDDKLKLSLMATFVRDNKMRCEEINTALESGDIKLAHRIAHTLKSNAGNLGKTKLQKAAENVEYLLKDGKNLVTAEHLSTLEDELAAVLGELVPLVKESAPPPQAQAEPLDAEKTKELFAELKPLLERGNAESLKYIDKLRTIPGTDEPLVRKLIQQMEDLDFEDATETLCELRMRS